MRATTTVRRSLNFLIPVWLALTAGTLPVGAWNQIGHRVVAELAWRQMSAEQRQEATELLRQHPHYKRILTADVPAGVNVDEWAFLTAAVWPDSVRPAKGGRPHKPESVTKYDLYPHAIGFPFVLPTETNPPSLENFHIAKPNAEMVLADRLATLKDRKADPADRAVSLCWVLHLFGDLHQPLHTANLVTKRHPHGAGLGGSAIVLDEHGKRITLHAFWDELIGVGGSYHTVAATAKTLATAPELQPAKLQEYREDKAIAAWVQEGFRVAVNFAYAENRIQFADEDDLKSGKLPATAIPHLKPDYIEEAHQIAQRRVVLAGQRLTDALKQVW